MNEKATKDYLEQNSKYWSQGVYDAPNPETYVFRTYSRIFKFDFGLDGSGHEKLLDFGCGPGGNTKFYHDKGFEVYGVDLSETDIGRCKTRMPSVADHFKCVNPAASQADRFFPGVSFRIVTAFQSLYYYNHTDLEARLMSLYDQMDSGGIIFATMMDKSCWYYGMSEPANDGLRFVRLNRPTDKGRPGLSTSDHYINFVDGKEDLKKRFHMFKPCHIGYYDACYRNDDGSEKHLIFIGQK